MQRGLVLQDTDTAIRNMKKKKMTLTRKFQRLGNNKEEEEQRNKIRLVGLLASPSRRLDLDRRRRQTQLRKHSLAMCLRRCCERKAWQKARKRSLRASFGAWWVG